MLVLAEDKDSLPISKALSKVAEIIFVASNSNFIPELERLLPDVKESNSYAVVLVDRVPNKYLEIEYRKLLDYSNAHYPYVYIVPIVCAEYIAFRSISRERLVPRYSWLSEVRRFIEEFKVPVKHPPKSLGYKESFNTFEKMCKLYVNNHQEDFSNIEGKGSAYDDWSLIFRMLVEYQVVKYSEEDIRRGVYGSRIKNIQEVAHKAQEESDKLQSKIHKDKTLTNWWEVQ